MEVWWDQQETIERIFSLGWVDFGEMNFSGILVMMLRDDWSFWHQWSHMMLCPMWTLWLHSVCSLTLPTSTAASASTVVSLEQSITTNIDLLNSSIFSLCRSHRSSTSLHSSSVITTPGALLSTDTSEVFL